MAHFTAPDDKACLDDVRLLLGFLPANSGEAAPRLPHATDPADRATPELESVLPANLHGPYDMTRVVSAVVDGGQLYEYSPLWARNIVCGLARIDGWPVGVVANQPQVLAGVLDVDASEKAARFVRTCDAFNIPLVAFVDVPGFLPGTDQELGGIIRHGAKLLYAFCEATVPRIQVVTRKAYGGAYVVMNSKAVGADLAFAWPSAELAVMGPPGAVDILHRRELEEAGDGRPALHAHLAEDYAERFANPWVAAEQGFVDDVIDPSQTRSGDRPGPRHAPIEAGRRPPPPPWQRPPLTPRAPGRSRPRSSPPRSLPLPSRWPRPCSSRAPTRPPRRRMTASGGGRPGTTPSASRRRRA